MREGPDLNTEINTIAAIGNYLPRQCGIATFTSDLVESLTEGTVNTNCWAVAMNDKPAGYAYPEQVRYEINQNNREDYRMAAEFLNVSQVDVVSLQHEYGIFGGPAGSYILELLRRLQMPVVTTLHTVLVEPSKEHSRVMINLAGVSDKLVVMSRRAADILNAVYDIPRNKIVYIPHGIPDIPFIDPNYYKDQFGLLGKNVLLTFGLLSRNKGLEYVIKALPHVIDKFPNLTYLILGATHPHVLKNEGESYRESLMNLVHKLDLSQHVEFQNRFVTNEELSAYLAAADIYITPYIGEAQITSGTLAYALGTGKAVISTPYWYAREMLSGDRGLLIPFRDSDSMADGIVNLLENDAERHQMRIRAYDFSRAAVWDEVARQYLDVFREVKHRRDRHPSPRFSLNGTYKNESARSKVSGLDNLPAVNLNHLRMLTDDTGLLQHAAFTVANRDHGYCTDDNARALIVAALAGRLEDNGQTEILCNRYLSFVIHAFDPDSGRFRNFMGYDRQWLEKVGSEDAHGRAIWALGQAIALLESHPQLQLISTVFTSAIKAAETFQSSRSVAFSLIGMDSYLGIFPGGSDSRRSFATLADRLYGMFTEHATENWPWPEEKLTYANGKLPHALILGGHRLNREDMVQTALKSLRWLLKIQTEDGHFVPVGNNGWFEKDGEKARFDQQPIEANAMIEACIAAFIITRDSRWLDDAIICLNWFLGQNDLNLSLYDPETGGCRDGLESDGVNENEGAESTLAWLLSLTGLHYLAVDQEIWESGPENPSKVIS